MSELAEILICAGVLALIPIGYIAMHVASNLYRWRRGGWM